MIALKFDKLYSKDREVQPCMVSIPFAKGALKDENDVVLCQKEHKLQSQSRVLSRYPDGSIRYLFLRFLADIPANKGTTVACYLQGEKKEAACKDSDKMISCIREENGYGIETGAMNFSVENGGNHMIQRLTVNGRNYDGEQFFGPVLRLEEESLPRKMVYGCWEVIEEGPVCVVLSNKGKLLAESETMQGEEGLLCEVRLLAYAEKTNLDVEVRLTNATEDCKKIASYEFTYFAKDTEENLQKTLRTCVADSNYKTSYLLGEPGETVEKEITPEFLINQSNEHFGEVFYGTFFADYTTEMGGLCATIYQAHQNFPKAVQAGPKGLVVKLVPEGATPICLQSGMARTQQFQLYFHEAEEAPEDINHQSILYQMPDRAIVPAEVYRASGLYPDIFVEKQSPEVECALIQAADNHTRSYGMLNWGDAPDPNYTQQGRGNGRLVWTNNEYDYPHACMMQFIRTGIRRFLDYGIVAGTHQIDVDVCHYSKDELLLGGQWEHTDGHCFGEMACSHEWVEGLLDCYHMTGDVRFFDTAVGIGENVLRLLDTPAYQKTGGLNARETGWALRTLTALYRETFDEKWTAKSRWIVDQFKEWAELYGGWLAPYTDNTVIRVPFMISVAVGSLMRYYREFPQAEIKALILNAVDDMLENCVMENGYFFYKELPSLSRVGYNPLVLEALAIAYELTGKTHYLEAGVKTFGSIIQKDLYGASGAGGAKRIVEDAVLVGNTGTKHFAQMFLPIATYYKALSENDMLKSL